MSHRALTSSVATGLVVIGAAILIAGPLNPPAGPVASSYKTLTEVEPRTAISLANTPGDADSLFKITQPGSYYLTGNITGVVGKHGIEIFADGVTLDLNGFDLVGVAGMGFVDGVHGSGTETTNITVMNGSVRNWGGMGVNIGFSSLKTSRVSGVLAHGNATGGISVGEGGTVSNCSASGNTGSGISTGDSGVVTGCSAYQNTGTGIFTGQGCTVTGCAARLNSSSGIVTGAACTISQCSTEQNANDGLATSHGCTVTSCSSRSNTVRGIFVGADCSIIGCTVTLNEFAGIVTSGPRCTILNTACCLTQGGPGVLCQDDGLRIEGSTVNGNAGFGISVDTITGIAELAVVSCTIRENAMAGISSEASTQVLDSIVSSNGGAGILLTGTGLVRGCTITSNTASGVELTGHANVVAGNTISSNAPAIAAAAGVLVQGTDNTIDGNRLFANTQGGIKVNTGGNLILRNYLARGGTTIAAVAGNSVAQTIASPAAGFVSTDPNANYAY